MTNYIVENKEMIPFKDMSDEDKLKIVNAVCERSSDLEIYSIGTEYGNWTTATSWGIGTLGTYRLKAKATPLNIPWEHIYPQWRYAAMSCRGSLMLFQVEPSLTHNGWFGNTVDYLVGEHILRINIDNVNWELSLTKRPSRLSELCP